MRKILQILFFLSITFQGLAQSDFDKALSGISNDLAEKLILKDKKRVVVLYITDVNKTETIAGKYFADMVSFNIINNAGNLSVFYRENLASIIETKKLIAEGYIDAAKAKELGRLLSVEAIIVGNYTILSNSIKLTANALDVNTGLAIAASMKDLPINADAGALLGINISNDNPNYGKSKGFNSPVQSDENYNNPLTVKEDCNIKNTGNFCFENTTQKRLFISVSSKMMQNDLFRMLLDNEVVGITVEPKQTQCLYDAKARGQYYLITEIIERPNNENGTGYTGRSYFQRNGQIQIEQCKSKTFTIR